MSTDETYNGWPNRETWAVALYINNDQGWQESVHRAIHWAHKCHDESTSQGQFPPYRAGEIIRDNVESVLNPYDEDGVNVTNDVERALLLLQIQADIGSLWRVDWTELGRVFLSDLAELTA
jgi:hypothetical protein